MEGAAGMTAAGRKVKQTPETPRVRLVHLNAGIYESPRFPLIADFCFSVFTPINICYWHTLLSYCLYLCVENCLYHLFLFCFLSGGGA